MTLHDILDHARLYVFIPLRVLYWPYMFFHVNSRKILFVNFNGKGYGCNPKYICEALRHSGNKFDLVWMTSKRGSLPDDVRNVNIKSFRALYEFATAKVWVCNNRLPFYIEKKKNQYYIHTWHGCLGFKQIEAGLPHMPFYYKMRSKHDSNMIDLLMTNSSFSTNYFKNVFWYKGPIAEVGSARNDCLQTLSHELTEKVLDYFHLNIDTKILLYAPTFRQKTNLDIYNLPFDSILSAMESRFKGKWVVLVRLHPILLSKAQSLSYSNRVLNASFYDDFQELLAASNAYITDYSSGIFDYIISKRPAFFYAEDIEEQRKERGMIFDMKDLPFTMNRSIKDLLTTITTFDNKEYQDKLSQFLDFVGINETGHASEYFAQLIIEKSNNTQ